MGAPIEKIMAGLPEVVERAKGHGYRSRGYVSCVITCPFSGPTPVDQVLDVAQRLLDMGCYEVSMGDTTGEGNPEAWTKLWRAAAERGMPINKLAVGPGPFSIPISILIFSHTPTVCYD